MKYAQPEFERRWKPTLDLPLPPAAAEAVIVDRYLSNTRLRLRTVTDIKGVSIHKLGQKVDAVPVDAMTRYMTTMYLEPGEYDQLTRLPARVLKKTRHRHQLLLDGRAYRVAVDRFDSPNKGLILVEIEFDTLMEAEAFIAPDWFGIEVTALKAYSGDTLATADIVTNDG